MLIVTKKEGNRVEDHRVVTSNAYKIYVMVLAERLREEVESGGRIPHNQTGFRRG